MGSRGAAVKLSTMLLLLAATAWLATATTRSPFTLEESEQVVKTEAGEVRVVRGAGPASASERRPVAGAAPVSPLHIGFISMEPKTLFIPQYLDSSLLLFVKRGEARVGWIHKDGLAEQKLKMGDIIYIPAGSTFYMINTSKGQRLHIICGIDTSESLGLGPYQSFFIGGGQRPASVLAGFHEETLSTALNVTAEELHAILGSETGGPIVLWTGEDFDSRRHRHRHRGDRDGKKHGLLDFYYDEVEEPVEEGMSQWSKLWNRILGGSGADDRRNKKKGPVRSPDPYNLYDRDPDFKNNYGWTLALDEDDYHPLKHSDIGVFLVNLSAGAMLAPHVNLKATEYAVVIGGAGTIEVVHPNGTSAMSAAVAEGDVFWIPRYFPFCQIASRSGPLVFFGFTTSARGNKPQFLAGRSSLLAKMMGPELAAGFGVAEEELRQVVEAQKEDVILPSPPPHAREEGEGRRRPPSAPPHERER